MNPNLGTFLSLDPFEGLIQRPMSLNGYSWVEGNPISNTDATGMSCQCDQLAINGLVNAYQECLLDMQTINDLNPNAHCSSIDTDGRIAYGCEYNRTSALAYALEWGIDAYHEATPGFDINAGTDCTNFVSQVLFAGGFMLTDNWNYTSNGTDIQSKTPSWSGVNWNMAWLTGNAYPRNVITDIFPLARISQFDPIRINDIESVTSRGESMSELKIGDVIAYEVPAYGDFRYEHQAIVIGWGCPYNHITNENRCIDGRLSDTYVNTYSEGLVPWIVDHGLTSYADEVPSRQRPYNHHRSYFENNVDVIIHSISIPDIFDIERVILA